MSSTAAATVLITHEVGLHARPSVKFTKLAKTFAAQVEVALDAAGPWFDAKSIVKVMAAKAPKGTLLHLRADGDGCCRGGRCAEGPCRARFRRGLASMSGPLELKGISASAGYAEGPIFDLDRPLAGYVPPKARRKPRRPPLPRRIGTAAGTACELVAGAPRRSGARSSNSSSPCSRTRR